MGKPKPFYGEKESPMPQRDAYRRKARECLEVAETILDPAERSTMLSIAQHYLSLAEHVQGRRDRATAHRTQGDSHPENDS
jgi:hypothetical protein